MEKIILASRSPQRQKILTELGIPFRIVLPDEDERIDEVGLFKKSEFIARKKAYSIRESDVNGERLILASDTLVIADGKAFGKPADISDARMMMNVFSGKCHDVTTGIAVYDVKSKKMISSTSCTKIYFKKLSEEEIENYLLTDEWKNAAGGYRIQGKSAFFIEKMEGSYSSVVGLPIFELYDILSMHNFSVWK